MVIGAVLLGAELFVVEADFFLVFLGVSAVLTGLTALAMPSLPWWAQWLLFAAVALISMVFFRKRVYMLVRGGGRELEHDLLGQVFRMPERVSPGETCRVEHQGSTWTVRNEGPVAIEAGGKARVTAVHGVVLGVCEVH
jgi:hypothetical protein